MIFGWVQTRQIKNRSENALATIESQDFWVILMLFFAEDGRCDSLAIGLFPTTVREVAFPTNGLDFIVMSICSGLRFYKDLGVPKLGGADFHER